MKDFFKEDIILYSTTLVKEALHEMVDPSVDVDTISISEDAAINLVVEDVVKNPYFAYELEKDILFFEENLNEVAKAPDIRAIEGELKVIDDTLNQPGSATDTSVYPTVQVNLNTLLSKVNTLPESKDKTVLIDKINKMLSVTQQIPTVPIEEPQTDGLLTDLWSWGKSLVTSSLFSSKLSTGLILAGSVIGLYYLYKKFWDRDCSTLTGPEKAECELKLMNTSIAKLRKDRSKCNEAENPTKCKQEFSVLIEKWETKKQELLSN